MVINWSKSFFVDEHKKWVWGSLKSDFEGGGESYISQMSMGFPGDKFLNS